MTMNIERYLPAIPERNVPHAVIDFAEIRNPLGHSPHLTERMKEKNGTTETSLIYELANLWRIPKEMIVVGRGSTDIIKQIPRLFLRPSDLAVVPVPTYFGLLEEIPTHQTLGVQVPGIEGFLHTPEFHESLLSQIDQKRPGLVWLCSPNNPTGVVIPLLQIKEIAHHAAPGIVVIDEAYQELVDPANTESAIRLIENLPNIIVTRTFSKAYGLPDIQVGIGIAHPQIITRLQNNELARPAVDSLVKASAALTDQEHIWNSHLLMNQETAFVWEQVQSMENIEMGARTESGVCIFRHKTKTLGEDLLQAGIKTRDFNLTAGLRGMNFVRLGLLDRAKNILLVNALRACDGGDI